VIALLLSTVLAGELGPTQLSALVASHKGQPVVVNFWATWCAPCVKEFPAIMAFARDRRDVVVISVSIDDKQDRPALEAFVGEHRPPFPVYVKAPGPDEDFINGIDPEWRGAVPMTLVFNRSGKRSKLIQGEHSRSDIERALKGSP
jgi:thiol-disulfide isomerase/thioredoxin